MIAKYLSQAAMLNVIIEANVAIQAVLMGVDTSAEESDSESEDKEETDVLLYDDNLLDSDDKADGNPDGNATDFGCGVLMDWQKRRKNLVRDYSQTGRLLSPEPRIMEDAKDRDTEDDMAVERLIEKLILNPTLVGKAKTAEFVRIVNKFCAADAGASREGDRRWRD